MTDEGASIEGLFQNFTGPSALPGRPRSPFQPAGGAYLPHLLTKRVAPLRRIDLWNPGTLYLGGPREIFRSSDRGLTWTSIGEGLRAGRVRMVSGPNPGRLAGIAPTALGPPGFDPTAPRLTINYLFDTFDGGAHWRNVILPGGNPATNQVMDLARSAVPESPVYAASNFGIARLLPRARFWRAVGTRRFPALSVAVDPLDPSRLYAGTADGQVLVFGGAGG